MEKPLHERLRIIEKSTFVQGLESGDGFVQLTPSEAKKLADEIERNYISIPTDENGQPWSKNDTCNIFGDTSWKIAGFGFNENIFVERESVNGYELNCLPIGAVKRHAKALDADGVEVKVGDTVYSLKSGSKATVVEMLNSFYDEHEFIVEGEDGFCGKCNGRNVTHREPDSLKKLRDEMSEYAESLHPYYGRHVVRGFTDRLTAIMERDA